MSPLQKQIEWCRRVQYVLGIGMGVAVILFYTVGYRPAINRQEATRQQIRSKQRQLEANQFKASSLPALALAVQQLERRVQEYDLRLPKQPELGQFIRDMTQISQQLALQDWRFEPGLPKRGDSFYEQPIQMSFQGDFLNVASLLRQVEDLQRLTRVRKLMIKGKPGRNGMVDVEVAMNIYFSEG